uniref:RNA-dependent RNA polymerase n=1 Tax=Crocidura lasiura ribovirus 18 TaxID=3139496 RepID=A0AB38ZJT2_9VIRU
MLDPNAHLKLDLNYFRTIPCGCKRHIWSKTPSKQRSGQRSVTEYVKKLFSKHTSAPPPDFRFENHPHFPAARSVFPDHFMVNRDKLKKPTSPGFVLKKRYGKTKKEVIEKHWSEIRSFVHSVKTGKTRRRFPALLSGTSSKYDLIKKQHKVRVAYSFDLRVIAAEAMFFYPLYDALKPNYVPTPENRHFEACILKPNFNYDFSSFDTSVPGWLVEMAFSHILTRFDVSKYRQGTVPKSRQSLIRLLMYIKSYYCRTPFKLRPEGQTMIASDGVPSGGMFTNLLDSLISYNIMRYVHAYTCRIFSYGDDCHAGFCYHDPHRIERAVKDIFCMSLKTKPSNEHNCLTYTRVECHKGKGFRSGQDLVDILNCTDYVHETAFCLTFGYVTEIQHNILMYICSTTEKHRYLPYSVRKYIQYILDPAQDIRSEIDTT